MWLADVSENETSSLNGDCCYPSRQKNSNYTWSYKPYCTHLLECRNHINLYRTRPKDPKHWENYLLKKTKTEYTETFTSAIYRHTDMVSDQHQDLSQLPWKAVNFCLPIIPPSSLTSQQVTPWFALHSSILWIHPSTQNGPPPKNVFCALAMKTPRWSGK